jgi:hypothetical protein
VKNKGNFFPINANQGRKKGNSMVKLTTAILGACFALLLGVMPAQADTTSPASAATTVSSGSVWSAAVKDVDLTLDGDEIVMNTAVDIVIHSITFTPAAGRTCGKTGYLNDSFEKDTLPIANGRMCIELVSVGLIAIKGTGFTDRFVAKGFWATSVTIQYLLPDGTMGSKQLKGLTVKAEPPKLQPVKVVYNPDGSIYTPSP